MFNSVTLVGRLTRDAEVSEIHNDKKTPVVRFTLAVDRDYKNGDGKTPTDFWPVQVFGEYGTKLAPHLARGRLALVDGAAHLDSRKDETGEYHTYAYIAARQIRFMDRPKQAEREPGQDEQ